MNIRNNYLNLPEFIEFSNCKIIEYTYDATGVKLKKTIKSGNAVTSTHDYVGDIEYKNQFLDAIYHPEGRLYFEDTIPRYEYVIRDHLGNARITFTDKNGNGTIDLTGNAETTEALEESHYYPFGMSMKGAWLKNEGRENKYLYNGKELDKDFGKYFTPETGKDPYRTFEIAHFQGRQYRLFAGASMDHRCRIRGDGNGVLRQV